MSSYQPAYVFINLATSCDRLLLSPFCISFKFSKVAGCRSAVLTEMNSFKKIFQGFHLNGDS